MVTCTKNAPKIQQPFYSYAYTLQQCTNGSFFSIKTIFRVIRKVTRSGGAKTASFGIIGHQNA